MVGSRYLMFYLHAAGEDIRLARKMLDLLRNLYQVTMKGCRSMSLLWSILGIVSIRERLLQRRLKKIACTSITIWLIR
jgi:hypothetical protein